MNISRRGLVRLSAATLTGAAVVSGRAQAAGVPEAAIGSLAATQPPLHPSAGPPIARW
jgi:manganese oxidase